ncbi:hypothetical protein [Paenibacillus turpanensis]|uniref:hypothetical protein n=1 Tax=Paenibacillus turpanensis TaxID=2689078 RepID=UPI00140A2282|nr:hypothetical protein [Paenibacillus turpanensis]
MAFVLKHKESGQIAAAVQKNSYDLGYYGVGWWHSEEEAAEAKERFLQSAGCSDPESWLFEQVDEHKLKMFNVKLKNDPQRKVFLTEAGQIAVE